MSRMINSLSTSLAQAIGKEEMVCRGLIRLTIMDSVGHLRQTSNYSQTMTYIKMMNYRDWKNIIEGSVLFQRLKSVGIKEPTVVVAKLKQTLIEQQSLLTMTAL